MKLRLIRLLAFLTIILCLSFEHYSNELDICSCDYNNHFKVRLEDENSHLNIRSHPSIQSEIVGTFDHGDNIISCETKSGKNINWKAILFNNYIGYVSSEFIITAKSIDTKFIFSRDNTVIYGEYKFKDNRNIYNIEGDKLLNQYSGSEIPTSLIDIEVESIIDKNRDLGRETVIFSTDETVNLNGSYIIDTFLLPGQVLNLSDLGFPGNKITSYGQIGEKGIDNYGIYISDHSSTLKKVWCQDLYYWSDNSYEGGIWPLIVGDFNGDSIMDLIFRTSTHYASKEYYMILSVGTKYRRIFLDGGSTC